MKSNWAGQVVTPTSGHIVTTVRAADGPVVFRSSALGRLRWIYNTWAIDDGVSYDLDADQENDRPAE